MLPIMNYSSPLVGHSLRVGFALFLVLALVLTSSACSKSGKRVTPSNSGNQQLLTRSFYMGFTPWPYDDNTNAVTDVYSRIQQKGDIIAHHFTQGIPWQESLDNAPWPKAVEDELTLRADLTQAKMKVFLALDALNFDRDSLALMWQTADNQPLPPHWANKRFNDPEVISAYIRFARHLIDRLQPDYFCYTSEVTELILNSPDKYQDYLVFAQAVYDALKTDYPQLPLLVSIAVKSPSSAQMATIRSQFPSLLSAIDMVGISLYPYIFFDDLLLDPSLQSNDWLMSLRDIAGGKPLAVTETGWIAEDLEITSESINRMGSPQAQEDYVLQLLLEANRLSLEFVIWFTLIDYDPLWEGTLGRSPIAKIWKDTGLYDEALNPRPALSHWDDYLLMQKSK